MSAFTAPSLRLLCLRNSAADLPTVPPADTPVPGPVFPSPRPSDLPPIDPDPRRPAQDPRPAPGPQKRYFNIKTQFCAAAMRAGLVASCLCGAAMAQSVPEQPKSGDIVINPTLAECNKGWTTGESKFSKEQFQSMCAVLTSPAEIVANPTLEECNRGWLSTMRWTKKEFDGFCALLGTSK